jgi:hypothetical protein
VVLEEREQVVGEVVGVAVGGVLLDLKPLGLEPVGREVVEGWGRRPYSAPGRAVGDVK